MTNTKFNGHKNWNCWNVSLWLNNDEYLYRMMLSFCKAYKSKTAAALQMLYELQNEGIYKTPDGAPYSASSIILAMRGLEA
jgi:hypothetical protein